MLAAPALPARAQSAPRTVRTALATVEVTEFARGLQHPWGLAFLPEGRMLVTERPGRLRLVEPDGRLSVPLAGVPTVLAQGQGGLLGVVLSP
ncbi:MAG: PQQ-dependent sugar dehydrogenase, partial [Burkholderiales bacterium]